MAGSVKSGMGMGMGVGVQPGMMFGRPGMGAGVAYGQQVRLRGPMSVAGSVGPRGGDDDDMNFVKV